MTPEERQRNAALTAGICFFAGCIIVWAAMCAPGRLLGPSDAHGSDGPYLAGDTLQVSVVAVDSSGIEILPTSAKVYFDYLGSRIDSLYYPSGGLSQDGSLAKLDGTYVIPTTWSHSWTLSMTGIFTGDGFTDALAFVSPDRVRINSASIIDSLTAGAIGDLWSGIASGEAAIIDTTDCTNCGVYASGGAGASDVPVYITRSSTFTSMSDVVGFTWSASGFWRVRVPATPGVADTFYVWAYRQGSYQPSAAQVIVSE